MIIRLWRILRGWFMARRLPDPAIAHRERMEAIDREHQTALWEFCVELAEFQTGHSRYNAAYQNSSNTCASLANATQNQAGMYGNLLANQSSQLGNIQPQGIGNMQSQGLGRSLLGFDLF